MTVLNVWIEQQLSGVIAHNKENSANYDFAYRQPRMQAEEVSLTMPYDVASYLYRGGLHPIFQMNLPEGELRGSIERKFRKTTPHFDDLSLLEVIGQSQIGRLRFANVTASSEAMPQQSVQELLTYHGAENMLHDLMERFSSYSGVSGVQPKVLIRDAEFSKTSQDNSRITYKSSTHIVKASDQAAFPHLAANEYFCMLAAKHAGLDVPVVSLSENNLLLIVERFDLAEDGQYQGFEDFCVLSGLGTQDKYAKSCEHIAKTIAAYVSPDQRATALETLFRSLVLSSALQNGDAHLKNFGVLYPATNGSVKLSPSYDIVTTTAYIKTDIFALTMEGSKRFPDAAKLLRFAKLSCNLQPAKAQAILHEVAEAVLKVSEDLKRHIKDFPEFKEVGTAMLTSWHEGVDRACSLPPHKSKGVGR
jgi:serine/threonine-protein kinase HipA